ncbi:hypothetical protein [Leptolyngbya sp. 'hensonii']|nr:hypothetical protein [Leptolyngbya sp. 'hensonii']
MIPGVPGSQTLAPWFPDSGWEPNAATLVLDDSKGTQAEPGR